MSVHQQLFQLLDQPMLILKGRDKDVKVEDANQAFLSLTGFSLEHLKATGTSEISDKYHIDLQKRILKSEIKMKTKSKPELAVRIEQIPLPQQPGDPWLRALLIFEDLTAYKWIDKQQEKGKVLISGIVDKHLHIRFLRDSLAPLSFEPDSTLEDETLLNFIAENERPRMLELLRGSASLGKERTITVITSKLSGVELEMELTYCPIPDGEGKCRELAFVIWDLRPADEDGVDSGMKLKIWMAKRDISTGQLSASTGISQQTISKLRNGKIGKPQRLTAELIASELRVEIHRIWPSVRK